MAVAAVGRRFEAARRPADPQGCSEQRPYMPEHVAMLRTLSPRYSVARHFNDFQRRFSPPGPPGARREVRPEKWLQDQQQTAKCSGKLCFFLSLSNYA